MRRAIISDIHANLAAFEAVLADIDTRRVDEIVCLGDVIGYGPDPNAVMQLLQARDISSVIGNHELGICDESFGGRFNPQALQALECTNEMLSASTRAALCDLPHFIVRGDARFVHGAPPEFVCRYLFEFVGLELDKLFKSYRERFCFVGHTHELRLVQFDGFNSERITFDKKILLRKDCRYIVNSGSVGQPRDGDNRAKYVLWDILDDTLEPIFVPYDIARTVEGIKSCGLPNRYADRLL